MKRAVWYLKAVLRPAVRHGLPTGDPHVGQANLSVADAACSGVTRTCSHNCLSKPTGKGHSSPRRTDVFIAEESLPASAGGSLSAQMRPPPARWFPGERRWGWD